MADLSTTERDAMERTARKRDSQWDSDPPLNYSLYFEGWIDARDFYGPERVAVWTCMSCGHISDGQSCDACGSEAMPGRWVSAEKPEERVAELERELAENKDALDQAVTMANDHAAEIVQAGRREQKLQEALRKVVDIAGDRPPYSQMALEMWEDARAALAENGDSNE